MTETFDRAGSLGPQPARRTSRNWISGRLVFGLLLLAFGLLWTLDNLDLVETESVLRFWPAPLLAWGLCMLTGLLCRRRPLAGVIWTMIGGWLLLWELDVVPFGLFDLWPLVLVIIGATLVGRAWRGGAFSASATEKEPTLSAFVMMGGIERKVSAQSFRGGEVNAVMGGADIDLRGATLASEGAILDVFAMFGGVDVIVPEGWRVIGHVTPVLGAFEDSTMPPTEPNAPTLNVRGLAVMGGVEVKHAKSAAGRRPHRHEWRNDGRTGDPDRERG
jgi:predicted membrane protein